MRTTTPDDDDDDDDDDGEGDLFLPNLINSSFFDAMVIDASGLNGSWADSAVAWALGHHMQKSPRGKSPFLSFWFG